MRGTAAALVCLISLQYLSVIDVSAAKFTSENGMPGREHEDRHPRRSADVKRSLPKTMRQEPDYNWEDYGGIPNIPGYMYRDAYVDTDLDFYEDGDEYVLPPTPQRQSRPEGIRPRGSAGTKRSLSASSDETKRQDPPYFYDNGDFYKDIPIMSGNDFSRDAGVDADEDVDADKDSFSKTVKRLLSPVFDAVRQLWGKLSGKSLDSVGGGDTKRQNAGDEPLKKRAMENRNDKVREATNPKNRNTRDPLGFLTDLAKKALDFVYNVIDKIDVSKLTEETKKLKEAVLDILKKAKEALEKLLDSIRETGSSSSRRARSVGKRTNTRDALESYLTSLRSHKRSKARNPFRRSMKGNTSARASDMTVLMDLMTEMEECIRKIPPTNTSRLGVKCIVSPLLRILAPPKLGRASGITMDEDSSARSDTIEFPDNPRRLNFPWGSIFLIPIYNGQYPGNNSTVPPNPVPECDNVTTTTTEPTTTTTTTTTTEAQPIYDEPGKAVRSDSRYRSKYDNVF